RRGPRCASRRAAERGRSGAEADVPRARRKTVTPIDATQDRVTYDAHREHETTTPMRPTLRYHRATDRRACLVPRAQTPGPVELVAGPTPDRRGPIAAESDGRRERRVALVTAAGSRSAES